MSANFYSFLATAVTFKIDLILILQLRKKLKIDHMGG